MILKGYPETLKCLQICYCGNYWFDSLSQTTTKLGSFRINIIQINKIICCCFFSLTVTAARGHYMTECQTQTDTIRQQLWITNYHQLRSLYLHSQNLPADDMYVLAWSKCIAKQKTLLVTNPTASSCLTQRSQSINHAVCQNENNQQAPMHQS